MSLTLQCNPSPVSETFRSKGTLPCPHVLLDKVRVSLEPPRRKQVGIPGPKASWVRVSPQPSPTGCKVAPPGPKAPKRVRVSPSIPSAIQDEGWGFGLGLGFGFGSDQYH